MIDLTLVVVAKDEADMAAFDARECVGVDLRRVINLERNSLAAIANRYLAQSQRSVFGLCHADTVFGAESLSAFAAEARRGSICGLVGVDSSGVYRCCYLGADGCEGQGPVSTLDGMGVFFRVDLGLRFDAETFGGLHCHVEDLCLQGQARGVPVIVPSADAHHRTHVSHAGWLEEYRVYRARLAQKWAGVPFWTT